MRRLLLLLLLPLALAGCGAESVWAPDDVVARAVVPNTGPTSLKLVTVISTRNGSGGHSGLIVNASQRVIFDPAGSFQNPLMPERDDVLFGLTDRNEEIYFDYHARPTWYVVTQEVKVSPQVAEQVLHAVEAHGAVPKAFCAHAISGILQKTPGFESIHSTMFPVSLMKEFAKIPGVVQKTIHDEDVNDSLYVRYVDPKTGATVAPQDMR